MAILLDGKSLANLIEQNLVQRVQALRAIPENLPPRLVTLWVGEDPASEIYLRMKARACERVGIEAVDIHLPTHTSTETLLEHLAKLNQDHRVHGILLQHPVPQQIDERRCFDAIDPRKDVDGVSAMSFGRMSMGEPAFGPATPTGILHLLHHYGLSLAGRHAVVVGRSPILGLPMAMQLMREHATITVCHSRTQDLASHLRRADVLVVGVGKANLIPGDWISPGTWVVDAGFHPGKTGDIDIKGGWDTWGAYTPVPGGVGPMTIATLLRHTVWAAEVAARQQAGYPLLR